MDNFNNTEILPHRKINIVTWIIVLVFFILIVADVKIFYSVYKNKKINDEIKLMGDGIALARPIINTFDLPEAQVGKKYQALIMATVHKFNTAIDGKIVSGLPEGLQLTACRTEFNSPINTFSKVNSLARCSIVGIPKQRGEYQIKVFFSIPEGKISAEETIPLLVKP